MKRSAILLLAVLFVSPTFAQDAGLVTMLTPQKDGSVELLVQNRSTHIVTALIVEVDFVPLNSGVPRAMLVKYSDSATNPFDRPLSPNDSQTFQFGGPRPGPDKMRVEPKLQGAIFDDGSAFGDASWADRLVQQRRFLLQYLNAAMDLLSTARDNGISRDLLLGRIQSEWNLRLSRAQSHEEERAIRQVYREAQVNFERMTARDGSQIPLNDRIQQISSQFLQERQRLLASKPTLVQGAAK